VLYRQDELLKTAPGCEVWIACNDEDADAMIADGHVAVSAPGGRAWLNSYCEPLKGHPIRIIARRDAGPGMTFARLVERQLKKNGHDRPIVVSFMRDGFQNYAAWKKGQTDGTEI
jgi:hypothetical protein